jgi:hypothetical protein
LYMIIIIIIIIIHHHHHRRHQSRSQLERHETSRGPLPSDGE